MHLCIIFLLCAVVYGIGRISEPDLRAVNFADKIEGHKLNGTLIREIEVDSESSCQLECVDEERCRSYNFGTIKGDSEKFKCHLSASDRFAAFADFTEDNNFVYRGIEAIKDRKLNGSLLRELEVASEISCLFECVSEDRCLSYNFLPIHGKGTNRCQLSSSDRFISSLNFTKEDGAIYSGIQSTCEPNDPCTKKETCVVDYKTITHFCKCIRECPKNCYDYYQYGSTTDGVYWIYPDKEEPFQVLCDMATDSGGWTILQRRMDGSVDFYADWESYKKGFGNLEGEFWLGNNYLHRLTASANMLFRIVMEDYDGDRRFAEYTTFSVADESDDYRVTINGYRGTAGDALLSLSRPIRNMRFTTKERDNDVLNNGNCAMAYRGGWWYSYCHDANPNGLYQGGGHAQGVTWYSFRGHDYSLKRMEIKLRPA